MCEVVLLGILLVYMLCHKVSFANFVKQVKASE